MIIILLLNINESQRDFCHLLSTFLFKNKSMIHWVVKNEMNKKNNLINTIRETSYKIIIEVQNKLLIDLNEKHKIFYENKEIKNKNLFKLSEEKKFLILLDNQLNYFFNCMINLNNELPDEEAIQNSFEDSDIYQLFIEKKISIDSFNHWFFLKSKCILYENKISRFINFIEKECNIKIKNNSDELNNNKNLKILNKRSNDSFKKD